MPRDKEHTLKINYLLQARVRPPHFVFFLNARGLFEKPYERFLMRNLAKEFGMSGVPLRLTLRSTNKRENRDVKPRERKQSKMKERMEELKKKYGNFGM
jgi:GTP-binding protein